jgi:hypothetical protein
MAIAVRDADTGVHVDVVLVASGGPTLRKIVLDAVRDGGERFVEVHVDTQRHPRLELASGGGVIEVRDLHIEEKTSLRRTSRKRGGNRSHECRRGAPCSRGVNGLSNRRRGNGKFDSLPLGPFGARSSESRKLERLEASAHAKHFA